MLEGCAILFMEGPRPVDPALDSLCKPDEQLDELTKQILEVLFSSFLVVSQRQLKDNLEGGKYADLDNLPLALAGQTESVPQTNVGPERIFSQLDRLVCAMPSASTIAMGKYEKNFILTLYYQLSSTI